MSAPSATPAAEPAVLSIQSEVAYGHVGNSAATLPLQRLGFDVLPINTVQLAHHPGHGTWCGHKVEPERIAAILKGVEQRGALPRCDALLSGYLGDAAVADIVLDGLAALRAVRPDALFQCDPVIGDDAAGVFVSAGIPEAMRERLVPAADIVTPNRFELELLTGQPVATLSDARRAAAALRALGPKLVVATSLTHRRVGTGLATHGGARRRRLAGHDAAPRHCTWRRRRCLQRAVPRPFPALKRACCRT